MLSYGSLGASSIRNARGDNDTVVVAEGLEVFRVPVPDGLVGRSLAESALRGAAGCTMIALARGDTLHHEVDVRAPLERGVALVLIGDAASQRRFPERHPSREWVAGGRGRTADR